MKQNKSNRFFYSLLINVLIPVMILSKGNVWFGLNPWLILAIALGCPLLYGVYDMITTRKVNTISVIGLVSIGISGIMAALEIPSEWIALKEASVPLLIGILVMVSGFTPFPIVDKMLYSKEIFNIDRINQVTTETGKQKIRNTLKYASYMLFGTFMLSSLLNYLLARTLIHSPSGTPEFNTQLAKMNLYSFPVIVLPSVLITALIVRNIYLTVKSASGLTTEEIFVNLQSSV